MLYLRKWCHNGISHSGKYQGNYLADEASCGKNKQHKETQYNANMQQSKRGCSRTSSLSPTIILTSQWSSYISVFLIQPLISRHTHGTYILLPLMPPICPPPTPSPLYVHQFSLPSHGARHCTGRKLPFHFLVHRWEQFMPGLSPCLSLSVSLLNQDYTKLPRYLVSWHKAWSSETLGEFNYRLQDVCDTYLHCD